MPKLILASSSERRLTLLKQIGYVPDVICVPNIDESIFKFEKPKDYSRRIAKDKAIKVARQYPDEVLVSADTVVCIGRRILDKALTSEDAYNHLSLLSGRRHRVYTSVSVIYQSKILLKTATSIVKFKRLTKEEIKYIIESRQWYGKSGGYALQGIASAFISWIRGSDTNIIGLPLHETYKMLNSLGVSPCSAKIRD